MEAKWTSGPHPVLFVESTAGTWRATVDTDDATWSVRGPDPDDEAHYASGEAANADVAEGAALDLKGRIAAAKRQTRAYILGQMAAGGTKKTRAILEAEIAAARPNSTRASPPTPRCGSSVEGTGSATSVTSGG